MKFSSNYQPRLQRSRFLVFVYGSLRKGFGNHALLKEPSTKFIGPATIRAKLFTQHWGWPFIIFSQSNKNHVVGEIYEVNYTTFQRLDALEGYSPRHSYGLFVRKHANATMGLLQIRVWVYEGGLGLQGSGTKTELPSGDWRIARQEHDAFAATDLKDDEDEVPAVTTRTSVGRASKYI
jgi:gamma-glutamylcyclotransferase (GGCT)/AIG2-like uncharacterized protein YtfP